MTLARLRRRQLQASAPMETSIEVRDLSVAYRTGLVAVRKATFRIEAGTICGLVGINGSGKSTLFKALMGQLAPFEGDIRVSGRSVGEALAQGIVAYVPQNEEVDWTFPVLVDDVVMMGRYGHMGFLRLPAAEDKAAVDTALQRVGMGDFRHRQIGELSGGQRKRIFLARALAQGARIILLDEPFTGVDVTTEAAIVTLLRQLRDQGVLILVSTHNLGSVPDFCDEVILFNRTVLAYGPTESTFTEPNLLKAFGGALRHVRVAAGDLHDDADTRSVTVLTDDERPVVIYGDASNERIVPSSRKPEQE